MIIQVMYVYVAPPTPVGAWSMALGLRQRFEYYYYYTSDNSILCSSNSTIKGFVLYKQRDTQLIRTVPLIFTMIVVN